MTAVDVSVLMVSYNTRELTLAALRALTAETAATRLQTIVVDNSSRDGSAAALTTLADIELIRLDRNIGFAAANNLAAQRARGEYLLLLNPDTVVCDGAVDRLVAFARSRPQAGIWGGRTLFGDGRLNPASCWGRMSLWNLACRASWLTGLFPDSTIFNGEAYGGWPRDSEREVDIVSGCFLLIRRETWQRLGGFDPAFFMYGEDADLCLRARALGLRAMVTPTAKIVHYGGASEAVRADKLVRLMAAKASLIARHFPPATRGLGLMLHAAWPLSRWLALATVAQISGSARHRDAASVWADVWRRRADWRRGWTLPVSEPATAAAAAGAT